MLMKVQDRKKHARIGQDFHAISFYYHNQEHSDTFYEKVVLSIKNITLGLLREKCVGSHIIAGSILGQKQHN